MAAYTPTPTDLAGITDTVTVHLEKAPKYSPAFAGGRAGGRGGRGGRGR